MTETVQNASADALIAEADASVEDPIANRFESEVNLREQTARGVVVNAAFQVGFALLNVLQRFAAAAFLTTVEFGIWGLVLTGILTLTMLKEVGISDKYIQQSEADQQLAFQKAFTLELMYTSLFCLAAAVLLPLYALLYGEPDILLPSLVLTLALLGSALNAPLWIPYRKMQFVRQRVLEAVNPVVSTVVMVGLAIAGAGYWSLVIGVLAGVYAAAAVAWITCPYPLGFKFDRGALRSYVSFSWPLLAAAGSGLLVIQGTMLVANISVGIEGVGAIALAGSLIVFAERVDAIISRTIYPAICAVSQRTEALFEAFVKSNRLALMWGLPVGVGLALFGADLVHEVLGDRWEPAIILIQGLGLLVGIRQLGFNWMLFFKARGETRPIAVSGAVGVAAFAVALVPLILAFGLKGYVAGMAFALGAELCVRAFYLSRLFARFNPLLHTLRAFAPVIPAAGIVLLIRWAGPESREVVAILAELAIYALVTIAATALFERKLIREIVGYLRRANDADAQAGAAPASA